MTYKGTVVSGVVVFPHGAAPPDGTVVTVVPNSPVSSGTSRGDQPTIWQKLGELGRQVEAEPCDLPPDLAMNHDHYLHGLPKRHEQDVC